MNIEEFLAVFKELLENDYVDITNDEFIKFMKFFETHDIPFYFVLDERPPENCIDCAGVSGAIPVNMGSDYNGMYFILESESGKCSFGLRLRRR